ncbi:hypothetical protein ACFLQQ_00930 [Actinomycetota bacterium]
MLFKEKVKFIIPDIPKGYKAHPFSIGNEFTMPKKLVSILDDNGFNFREYTNSFIVPPQAYLKHWFGRRFVPWQALLFNKKEIVYVMDSLILDKRGTAKKMSAENLIYLKLKLCLLYGKLDIVCSNGKDANQIEVEYNTTAHRILKPNLERFLKASWYEKKELANNEDIHNKLKKIPIKYRNGVYIYVLQKGEVLLDLIYIPRLVRKIGFIKINLSSDILFAITDRQLVILEDDISSINSYTWLLTYIPINNINNISFRKQNRITEITLRIKRNNLLKKLLLNIENKYSQDVKRFLEVLVK